MDENRIPPGWHSPDCAMKEEHKMDVVEAIIEWAKKERQPLYKQLAWLADEEYADLKADHTLRVNMVQELLEENRKLKKDLEWLDCLEEAGVGNWNGCSYAYELFAEREPKIPPLPLSA